MSAGAYNITIEQGTTWSITVIVKDAGGARNMTGWAVRMQIRHKRSDPDTLAELTTANGKIVLTGDEGKFIPKLTDAETAALSFNEAVYDIELIDTNDEVERILQGKVTLDKEVTR